MKPWLPRLGSLATFIAIIAIALSFSPSRSADARPIRDEGVVDLTATEPEGLELGSAKAPKGDDFVSYAPPSETLLGALARQKLGPNASQADLEAAAKQYLADWRKNAYHGPRQEDYDHLLQSEQRALAADSSPAAMGMGVEGTLRLFTVAVEFNGTDGADNFSHPISVDDSTCITDTVSFTGPLHNQIPAPGPRDNFSNWLPAFEKQYYEDLVLSETGLTDRPRPDLIDPEDGLPGMDVSGQSMRNYYDEVSGGRVQFDVGPAGVIAWLQVPHSQGYYAANSCIDGEFGRVQQMNGLPQNPRFPDGVDQLLVDIVDTINAGDPNFPWQDYDLNGDNVIDHVVIFHAGKDRSAGGGQQDYQAIWAHRGTVGAGGALADDGGTPADPSDDVRLVGYTAQYEDVETGVLVHEFGHDLGLPDLYDISGQAESDVVWWDLMSTGSNTGKLIGTHPTHMSAWSKWALGWTEPTVIEPTGTPQEVLLGQTSNPPSGSEQAVQINLPPTLVTNTLLLTDSTQAWWTNNDANWADVRLARDLDLSTVTGTVQMSFYVDGAAEEDWDYMFLEASTDGGTTWTQLKGFEVGTNVELTTPEGYSDPNGRLNDYGALKYGYTGDISELATNDIIVGGASHWVHAYHDLSAYAGQAIKVRFRYATDAAFVERGYFIDNIAVTAGATEIFNDPVEGGNANGWTVTVGKFDPTESKASAGWVLSNGIQQLPQYYLLEWRSFDGFDEGLKYTYNTVLSDITPDGRDEFRVDLVPANVPGMLVWHRDTRYGSDPFDVNNSVFDHFFDQPSEGPKGGLLVVDANPTPVRGPRNATFQGVPYAPGDNWGSRFQTTNAAFNLQGSPAVTLTLAQEIGDTTIYTPTAYAPMPGVNGFHDALGYYPGVEQLATPVLNRIYAFADADASMVVPARGYYPPKTPADFTGQRTNGNIAGETLLTVAAGTYALSVGDVNGEEIIGQQSGNPGSDNLQYGYHFEVVEQEENGSIGTIRVYNAMKAGDSSGSIAPDGGQGDPVTINVSGVNGGSPAVLALYSNFDESQATYIEGSATNGAVPVNASLAEVQAALRSGGVAALGPMAVTPGEATALVLTTPGPVDTGTTISFSYKVTRDDGVVGVRVVNQLAVDGTLLPTDRLVEFGRFTFLPYMPK